MTISALVSHTAAKPPALSRAGAQDNASGVADAAIDGDFGALLENHLRTAAAPIETASDSPAAPVDHAQVKTEATEKQGPNVAPDATTLLAAPLQMAPQAATVTLPPDAAAPLPNDAVLLPNGAKPLPNTIAERPDLTDLAAEGDGDGVVLQQGGKGAADIAVNGKNLPLTAAGIATAAKIELEPVTAADLGSAAQVRPESLVATPAPRASQAQAALAVEPKVGVPGWDGALGQRVVWMATRQQQVAEMHLNPPNLGPLEVRLTISNDQASAQFVSHHPAVREAIEAALPRLREMLADSGITLGNVQVGSESFAQSRAFDQGDARSPGQGGSLPAQASEPLHVGAGLLAMPREGMVDTFA